MSEVRDEYVALLEKFGKLAGIPVERHLEPNERITLGGQTQISFEDLLLVLAHVRAFKTHQYTEKYLDRYTLPHDTAMVYFDLRRKMRRLEAAVWHEQPFNYNSFYEALLDMAVYAVMGLQVGLHWETGEK